MIIGLFKSMAPLFILLALVAFSGLIFVSYYLDELNDRFDLNIPKEAYETFNFKFSFGSYYQLNAIMNFSFVTVFIALFILLVIMGNFVEGYSITTSAVICIVGAIPFVGMGLRHRTFNDDSRFYGDDGYGIGYSPNYYFAVSAFVCWFGYISAYFSNSIMNGAILFIATTFCYSWLLFPDKYNKYLPFENRSDYGCYLYLGIIAVFFIIFLKSYAPPSILEFISSRGRKFR
ncbi:MAG: hypothetical protein Q4P18_06525 [Methanobrevibacter sp.]|uniref:hypothetical protein n=1 Tax=Methanobrevibacter sp. TaxID=66852 RepID=UPI0026E0BC79|nr:hypothetical protein [Methanobrevibacter sp.]MDO5849170.1 hypothetical protein [Methanobrevibacter sp.]